MLRPVALKWLLPEEELPLQLLPEEPWLLPDDPRLLPLEPPDELLSDEPDEPWPWATKQAAQSASSAINCFFIPFVLFVCCFDRLKRHHS
jgi:hypothetical protein